MKKFLKNPPLQTFIVLLLAMLFHDVMPREMATGFYTLSVLIKDIIVGILPVAVFFFIASSLIQFEKKGIWLVLGILIFEAVSNGLASTAAYGLSFIGEHLLMEPLTLSKEGGLQEVFSLNAFKPTWWRVEYGMFLGVMCGLVAPYISHPSFKQFLDNGRIFASAIFARIFARIIPLFVFGFFLNLLLSEGTFYVLKDAAGILLLMTVGLCLYVVCIFMVAGGGIKNGLSMLKNALPAGFAAFSSMSSAATMPITIACTEKNLKHKHFASMLIPATTNIQQIGDCFCNIFLCCIILSFFGKGIPDTATFFTFLPVFILARYTTAGMIGGAIFIMIPLYQSYLGFSAEMVTLILGFNMILDPLITSTNVMANSGLCVLFEKMWNAFTFSHSRSS